MVGLCGAIGADSDIPDEMCAWITRRDDEQRFTYSDDGVELVLSSHPRLAGEQPAFATGEDTLVWVWGDVYGHGSGDDYAPRPGTAVGSAEFCAHLYGQAGIDGLTDLNGGFAIVVYDRTGGTVSFVTDRVGTRPIYYARASDGAVVFASSVQALPTHPAVDVAFETSYLQEYLALRRVFGVETPLSGVRELQPGAVTTVDVDDASMETRSYWRPHHDPVDRSASWFVDRITETLREIFAEWTDDDRDYGLLLSGGTDSRLVEACIDQPVTAFHVTDWESRETRVAERVAETAGDEFRPLYRDDAHEAQSLETTPALSNFSGWFDQAYFTAFESEIRDEVDALVSGLFADTLFGASPIRTGRLSLGPVGNVSVPIGRSIDSVDEYVTAAAAAGSSLPYFTPEHSLESVLADNVRQTADGDVVSHGVRYESLTDLVLYGDYYPLGADTEAIFSRSLMQICPYRTPFLDNRLLDIQQRMPAKYMLRRNVLGTVLADVAPSLADIPHAGTGVPPATSFPVAYVRENLTAFARKHLRDQSTPAPYLDNGPWPDRRELLREFPFAADALRRNEDVVRALPFLTGDGARETLRAHQTGEDHHTTLYSLLTLLEMPLTDRFTSSTATQDCADDAAPPGDDRPSEKITRPSP